jgi:hypothetical protein
VRSIACHIGVLVFVAMTVIARSLEGADAPANVSGTWTVSFKGAAGHATQTITIQQHGEAITGKFKGPRESGMLTGRVKGSQTSFT